MPSRSLTPLLAAAILLPLPKTRLKSFNTMPHRTIRPSALLWLRNRCIRFHIFDFLKEV